MTRDDEGRAQLGALHASLAENLVQFADSLQAADVEVTTTQLVTAAQALLAVSLDSRDDTRTALASSFVTHQDDRATFDALFEEFWRLTPKGPDSQWPEPSVIGPGKERRDVSASVDLAYMGRTAQAGETPPEAYSPEELLLQKDFSRYTKDDSIQARRYLRRLAQKLASAPARRKVPASRGPAVDLRSSLRLAARHDGEVLHLRHARRRIRRRKILLLCDVSGSMDVYSRFIVQFLYGMQHELPGMRTFVFSTRLVDVTGILQAGSFDDALTKMSEGVHGWSGGTRIGACLAEFNRRDAKRRIGSRTVVVIVSDGWDRGAIEELRCEMRFLNRHCYRLIWLNPLLGSSKYRPLAQGMAAALPWIDEFLSVHNLASLGKVGRTLMRLSNR